MEPRDAFDESEDAAGLDIAEQIEQGGGEYEVYDDSAGTPDQGGAVSDERQDLGEDAPRQRSTRTVPIHVVQEERQRRQELERRMNERDREWAVIQERLRVFQQQQEAEAQARRARAEAQRDPMPDPDSDPVGHALWQNRKLAEKIQSMEQQQTSFAQQQMETQRNTIAQTVLASIGNQVSSLQAQFAAQNPDYPDAFEFLANTRFRELELMGYDPNVIPQILEQERAMIVNGCLVRGENGQMPTFKDNPARVAYELARQRGWNGGAQAQGQAQRAPMSNQQRVAQMQNRVNRAQGMNGGRAPGDGLPPSMESLATMSESDFARLYASDPGLVDAIMGGRG